MWSIFSRDPAKDFAYVIGDKVEGLEEKSVWTLHSGKKKASGESVSIFAFDVKSSSESQINLAKSAFKRIKTLRHPNILTFLDGIETDKVIYIATEPVTPLETYLQNNECTERQNQLAISWGLHKVVKGLSFLVNDCSLIHNNVCMSSIFVDQAGEWKLGGVDYMYPTSGSDSVPPVKILPYLERYDPPEKSDLRRGVKGETWSSDMWGLGCLIWEVFNGSLPRTSSLKAFGKIPKPLVPNYCELVSANPSSRPNPAKFIKDCCRKDGFMNNPFVKTMLFLEEIQIKEQAEKSKFFSNLTSALDTFPRQLSRHKILPQLLQAYEFGNCGSMVLAPLFKVGKLLEHDEYQAKIVPCVVKLFSSTDRNTRVKLLQQIDLFVEHLQPQTVNDKIFPGIVSGFMDTNPVVRESTIKAMLYLAPKLNYKNLNEELMKHFARLQSKDDQRCIFEQFGKLALYILVPCLLFTAHDKAGTQKGGIRTNTTVCLGKIATYLSPQLRQRILCSAFLRALKDPFPPARQAAVIGLGATQNLFTLADTCHKMMPPLCSMTMDPEKIVRDQAFKVLKAFMDKLEKVSENPDLQQEMEKDVLSGGVPDTSAAGWAGWAMGGVTNLTAKVYNKATKARGPAGSQSQSSMTGSAVPNISATQSPGTSAPSSSRVPDKAEEEEDVEEEPADNEGWDDDEDWGDIDGSPQQSKPLPTKQRSQFSSHYDDSGGACLGTADDDDDDDDDDDAGDGWGDDDGDWGSIDDFSPKKTSVSDKFSASAKPETSKQSGGDWGWGNEGSSDNSSAHKKGALKLGGAKKPAPADDFGWIEEEFAPVEDKSVKPASAYNWGGEEQQRGDFFSMMDTGSSKRSKPTSKTPSSVSSGSSNRSTPVRDSPPRQSHSVSQSQSTAKHKSDDFGGSGWGDGGGWDDSSWDDTAASKESEAERKKREREEKRQQRQQELAQKREARKGGAMKLGAKKLGQD